MTIYIYIYTFVVLVVAAIDVARQQLVVLVELLLLLLLLLRTDVASLRHRRRTNGGALVAVRSAQAMHARHLRGNAVRGRMAWRRRRHHEAVRCGRNKFGINR